MTENLKIIKFIDLKAKKLIKLIINLKNTQKKSKWEQQD